MFGDGAGGQVHQAAHSLSIFRVHNDVNVVASNAEGIDRNCETVNTFTQPFPIAIAIAPGVEKELPSVAPMRQVIRVSLQQVL
jgi:hypothetical protein